MKLFILGISLFCFSNALAGTQPVAPVVRTTVPVEDAATKAVPVPATFSPTFVSVSSSPSVPTPLFSETENLQGKVFDADTKLRSFIPDLDRLSYSRVDIGEKAFFKAPVAFSESTPAPQDSLTVFRTWVTPQAFTRSKIHLASPQKFELWVNGEKLIDKLSVEGEIEKSGKKTAEFNFEVERYELVVKVLTTKGSKLPPMIKIEVEPQITSVPALTFSDGSEKRPVTISDVNEVDRLAGLRLSPNGKYVLLTYSLLQKDGVAKKRIEVRETSTKKIVFIDDASRNYAWMPNGARLYFRRSDPGDRCAYIAFDLESRKEFVLAKNLPDSDHHYTWLSDESALIVTRTDKWKKESSDWARVLNMADRLPKWRDRAFLLRYDLKKGFFEPLTSGAQTTALAGISPDSQKLIFSVGKIDYTQPEFSRVSFYLLDLKTLESEPIFEDEKYGVSLGAWSPDSKKILLLSGPNAFSGLGSTLSEGVRANSFDTQAFIYTFETKTTEPISKKFDPTISSGVWGGDGLIYFSVVDRDLNAIYRYDPEGKKYTKLNIPAENITNFNVLRDPKQFVPTAYTVGSGAVSFPKAYAVDLKENAATLVFGDSAKLQEEKLALPEVKPWQFTASDGTQIDGYYFLPADFDPTKKHPMVVYYYSGTSPTSRVLGAHFPFPLYAAQGYVVYVVQPSGTIGYGQEFSARHLNAWGIRTADDIIEGTKKFCEEHSFVNEKKIGCIGASYGGFMTMYLQTRTEMFAAAVSHAGISDITSYWGEGNWGYAYNAVAAAGSFPWKDAEFFIKQSPLFSSDKIKTPILLCHGSSDTNVPVGESIQMFAALKLQGKPVELLTFTGENHGIMNYARRKQWIRSHLAWFARWLKDDSDWWNTLYPDKNW